MREINQPESPNAEDSYEGSVGDDRKKLEPERYGLTHKIVITNVTGGQFEGYIVANADENGQLREVFLHGFGVSGSTLDGWTQFGAMVFSIALQYGAEFPMLARKIAHMRFEPYGETDNPEIPYCVSVPDYIVRWLALKFGTPELNRELDEIQTSMREVAGYDN